MFRKLTAVLLSIIMIFGLVGVYGSDSFDVVFEDEGSIEEQAVEDVSFYETEGTDGKQTGEEDLSYGDGDNTGKEINEEDFVEENAVEEVINEDISSEEPSSAEESEGTGTDAYAAEEPLGESSDTELENIAAGGNADGGESFVSEDLSGKDHYQVAGEAAAYDAYTISIDNSVEHGTLITGIKTNEDVATGEVWIQPANNYIFADNKVTIKYSINGTNFTEDVITTKEETVNPYIGYDKATFIMPVSQVTVYAAFYKENAPSITIEPSNNSFVYDGTSKPVTFDVKADGTDIDSSGYSISYYKEKTGEGVFSSIAYNEIKDVGVYKALFEFNGEYKGITKQATFTIDKKEVELAWGNTEFTYDGSEHVPTVSMTEKVGTEDVNATVEGAETNAGDNYTATVVLSGKNVGNYKLPNNSTTTFSIKKVDLTVTANNKTITYGEAPANDGVTYNGFIINKNTGIEETESALDGTLQYTYSYSQYGDVGDTYTITPGGKTSTNYNIKYVPGKLTVIPKEVSLSWSDSPLAYNGLAQPTVTLGNIVNGDSLSATVIGQQTAVGTGYTATVTGLEGDKAKNYKLPTKSESCSKIFTITPKEVSLKWADTTLTYNGSTQKPTVTVEGKVAGDDVSAAVSGEQTNAGGPYTATATLAGTKAGNYKLSSGAENETKAFSINPISVTVTDLKAMNRAYEAGNTSVVLTGGTVSGLLDGDKDKVEVDLTKATGTVASDSAGKAKTVTVSGVALSGVSASNYLLSDQPKDVTVDITEAVWKKNAVSESGQYGSSGSVDLSEYIAPGGKLGTLDDKYNITDFLTVSLENNKLLFTFADSVSIAGRSAEVKIPVTGAADYEDYDITITLTALTKNSQQVTITPPGTKTYGDPDFSITASSTTNGQIRFSVPDGSNITITEDGLVHIIGAGKTTITATAPETTDYAEKTVEYDLTVEPKSLTIKADNKSKHINDPDPELTVTATGLVTGDTIANEDKATAATTVKYKISRAAGEIAGTYTITPSGVANQGNYTVSYETGTLTIENKQAWTNKTAAVSARYGESGSVDLSALIAPGGTPGTATKNDTDNIIADYKVGLTNNKNILSFTLAVPSVKENRTATVTIPVTNATNYSDYNITVTIIGIAKSQQVIAFNYASLTKTYGDADFYISANRVTPSSGGGDITYAVTSGNNDNVVRITTEKRDGISVHILNSGTVTITATAAATDEYEEATASFQLVVNRKSLTIKADDKTKNVNQSDPELTVTATGLVSGDTIARADMATSTTTVKYTISRVNGEKEGTYIITPGGNAVQGNYDVSYGTGTLTIINPTYALTFNTDGGTSIATRYLHADEYISVPGNPTKTGYIFQGWDPALPGWMPEYDLTVKAIWKLDTTELDEALQKAKTYYEKISKTYPDVAEELNKAITAAENPTTPEEVKEYVRKINDAMDTAAATITGIEELEQYKKVRISDCEKLAATADSKEAEELISKAVESIGAYKYDIKKDLKANKDAIDAIVEKLKSDLEDLKLWEKYRAEAVTTAKALGKTDDSDTSRQLITSSVATMQALTWDPEKNLKENEEVVDEQMTLLQQNLLFSREFDAYKDQKSKDALNLHRDGDGDKVDKMIASCRESIAKLLYDWSLSIDKNKEAVDALYDPLAKALARHIVKYRDYDGTCLQVTYDLLPDAEIPEYKKQGDINRKKPGLFKEWKDDIKANGNIVRNAVYDYFEVTPEKSSYTYYYCDEEGVIKVNARKAYAIVKLIANDKSQKYEVRKKADKNGIAEFTLSELPPGTLTTKLEFENNYLLNLNTKIKTRFFLYDKNKKENETKQIKIDAVKKGDPPQIISRIKLLEADKVSFFRNGKVPIALKIAVVYYDDRGNKKTTVKTYEAPVQEDGSVSFNVVVMHKGNHKFELSYLKDTYVGTLKVQ